MQHRPVLALSAASLLTALVALPAAADPRELDRALADITRTWPHPMCWLRLAEHVGSDDRPHHAVIERYQL